jgi:ubiquitin carboxyl-terminal hydrolase 4/11/15
MAKKRPQKDKEKEKEKFKDCEPKGISGLLNLGNSCYLNSILQCLLHLPEIIVYMNSSKLKEDLEYNKNINQLLSEKDKEKQELYYKLVYEFEKLLKQIWEGYSLKDLVKLMKKNNQNDSDEISYKNYTNTNTKFFLEPREFKKTLSEIFPQFQGYLQQDAHEVLTDILDSFHLALNKSFNEGGLLISSSLFDSNLLIRKTQSFIADASHKAVNDSFIEDTFFGQLSSIFTCHKCHKKLNETYEPFSSLELTIPIEKTINLFILPLNPIAKEQIKLNININNNMSYEDLYQQMSKITGYTFNNYVMYWPNEITNKNESKKKRTLRSGKNSINEYSLKKNLFGSLENQDININECNLDKCQNFINSKSNDLIIMENYGIDDDIYNYEIYEYNIELKIMNNCKKANNNINKQDNLPRIFQTYFFKNEDDHLIFNNIYQYLESFTEKEKPKKNLNKSKNNNMSYNNKDLADFPPKKNKGKSKKTKDVNNLFLEEVRSFYKKNSNNHNNTNDYMQLEEENEISCEKKYILGIVCKNTSNDNNSNYQELVCPLCNKKSKKISDEYCECFCINEYFDEELKLKTKENKKVLTSHLINFIEQDQFSHKSLLTIIVHPYSNFSFQMLNKFSMYTVTTSLSKSKKKLPHQLNLLELFESFVAEEKIENMCTCDSCGDINFTYQKKDIHKFPQILIIHIKRFKNEIEKNEEKIEFPEDIDLSRYNNKGNIGKYKLNSVVFHQGTLVSGHYTAIFKYLPTNQWLFCNDTKIKFLKGVKIMGLNPSYNKDDISSVGDGYILFYRKDD